jgi:hypothetical protein
LNVLVRPAHREISASIAKVALATLLTGPVGGAGELLNQAIELVASARPKTVKSVMGGVRRGLELFASSEGLPTGLVDQALAAAERSLRTGGATLAECVDLAFDPVQIANRVLGRNVGLLEELDEGAGDMCRQIVRIVYRELLADPTALPGLDREFQSYVVNRLAGLDELPAETAMAVRRLAVAGLVADPRRTWRPDLYPQSALVRAEFAAVPFEGRSAELAELVDWCQQGPSTALRLYAGAGGMGKTRLMIQACFQMRARGWQAGFLALSAGDIEALAEPFEFDSPALVTVDYAELKRPQLRALIGSALARREGPPVRLVALARGSGEWWRDLSSAGQGVGDFVVGPATTTMHLPPLAETVEERSRSFQRAAESFAAKLVLRPPAEPPLDFGEEYFGRALFLHLAALGAVLGQELGSRLDLLDFALRRERGFWDKGVKAAGLSRLQGRPVEQAAVVLTLAGSAADRDTAIELISRTPLLAGQTAAAMAAIAEMFHGLYPGNRHWLEGVQPDLLGEYLIGKAAKEDPRVLQVFDGGG